MDHATITDFFGIGNAIRGAIRVYRSSARATGRTISLVNVLRDGDRVIFTNEREARRVESLARERGVKLSWVVVDPRKSNDIFRSGVSKGRTILDHSWVEEFYENAIERAARQIADLESQSSGFGEAHRETQHKALEMSKWR